MTDTRGGLDVGHGLLLSWLADVVIGVTVIAIVIHMCISISSIIIIIISSSSSTTSVWLGLDVGHGGLPSGAPRPRSLPGAEAVGRASSGRV